MARWIKKSREIKKYLKIIQDGNKFPKKYNCNILELKSITWKIFSLKKSSAEQFPPNNLIFRQSQRRALHYCWFTKNVKQISRHKPWFLRQTLHHAHHYK